jgi:hypothetical protein
MKYYFNISTTVTNLIAFMYQQRLQKYADLQVAFN